MTTPVVFTAEEYAPDILAGMPFRTLRTMVAANLGRTAPEDMWDNLLSVPVIARTIRVLQELVRSSETSIRLREDNLAALEQARFDAPAGPEKVRAMTAATAAKIEMPDWMKRARWFGDLAARRLAEATDTAIRVAPTGQWLGAEGHRVSEAMAALATLVAAVAEHRNAPDFADPDDLDDTLYAVLHGMKIPGPAGELLAAEEWAAAAVALRPVL